MFFNKAPKTHTLSLDQFDGRWTIFFSTTNDPEPQPIFEDITHLSSALGFVLDGLRRLDQIGGNLEVVDPTGEWFKWVESARCSIPTHVVY